MVEVKVYTVTKFYGRGLESWEYDDYESYRETNFGINGDSIVNYNFESFKEAEDFIDMNIFTNTKSIFKEVPRRFNISNVGNILSIMDNQTGEFTYSNVEAILERLDKLYNKYYNPVENECPDCPRVFSYIMIEVSGSNESDKYIPASILSADIDQFDWFDSNPDAPLFNNEEE